MYLEASDVNIGEKQQDEQKGGDLVYFSLPIIYSKPLKNFPSRLLVSWGITKRLFRGKKKKKDFQFVFEIYFIIVGLPNLGDAQN